MVGLNGTSELTGTSAQGATVTIHPDGAFSYDPTGAPAPQALEAAQSVEDTFEYTVRDADGSTDTATVTVTVEGLPD